MEFAKDLFTLLSIVMNFILGLISLYQFFMNRNREKELRDRIRGWQNHAEGIKKLAPFYVV